MTNTTWCLPSALPSGMFHCIILLTPQMPIHFQLAAMARKGQPQRTAEGNCLDKNADIVYKSTPVIGSEPYKAIHLGSHPWTHMDEQCLRHPWWEGRDPFYDIIFGNPVTTRHFSQFQLLWRHRRSRCSLVQVCWGAFRSYMRQMFDNTCDQIINWW